ncbi:Disease resistance protein [Melia azedarach]|uniref:Disease resistance protein n=1 Tax=Melia azedarach TaxID=155640 RepID=A0ACC1Y3K4_MELAZ|nr:Disease resistance protein [Melia azedarach]
MFGKGSKKIDAVKELINKGHFDVVAQKLPPPAVDVKPIGNIVGVDSIINEVWRCINEDSDRGEMIGLYGEAGVGKSTLLKKLNNKFPDKNHYFDLMIWVTVSKEANYLEKIQEVLPKKSGIWDEIWKNKDADGRATEIWTSLRNKKFVLFLDDVWERIDLSKVGVSLNDNQKGSKVVFTTKLEGVFRQMTADDKRFKVECLSPEAALHLFHERVGENVLNSNPEIPKLAEIIAKKCNGLPLALVTIGHAMTSRRSAREWQRAIDELQCNTSRFPVSREANAEKIQGVICKKLEISDKTWMNRDGDDRATEILINLRSKKFVLLLDDVWERIDLSKLGVSLDDNKKGSEEVCGQMEAHKNFKVDCLSPEAALHLFRDKVGEDAVACKFNERKCTCHNKVIK